MKPIILITTCQWHLSKNEQCRATWLKQCNIDYKFIFGQGHTQSADDELVLPIGDSYSDLPAKIQTSHRWALEHNYDFILKTDCDVYLSVPRLLSSSFEQYAYSGNLFWPDARFPFALGSAYWLNKQASEILVETKLPDYPAHGGDDVWVGRTMYEHNIPLHHDPKYYVGQNPNWKEVISVHTTDLRMSMAEIEQKFQ